MFKLPLVLCVLFVIHSRKYDQPPTQPINKELKADEPASETSRLALRSTLMMTCVGQNSGAVDTSRLGLIDRLCPGYGRFRSRKIHPADYQPATGKCGGVLIGTAIVDIEGANGRFYPIRAVIDSGSMDSWVTSSFVKKLGLRKIRSAAKILGLGGSKAFSTYVVSCKFKPRGKSEPVFSTNAIVARRIMSEMPEVALSNDVTDEWRSLEGQLADPEYDTPGPIDLLIAADVFPFVYDGRKIASENPDSSGPFALGSVFGWVMTGRIDGVKLIETEE